MHCKVGAGISNFKEGRRIAQKFHLWQVFVHPHYNWSSGMNDLSILRLTGRLAFNNYIDKTIIDNVLPSNQKILHQDASLKNAQPSLRMGQTCDIVTWDKNSSALFAAPVKIVDLSICRDSIQIPKSYALHEGSHICTRDIFKCLQSRAQVRRSSFSCLQII